MTAFEPTLTTGILFSNHVIREQGTGKNSFIGSFQNFRLPAFPFRVPPFYTTAILTNIPPEVTEVDLAIRIELPSNGMVIASAAVKVQFGNGHSDRNQSHEIVVPVVNLTIPSAGLLKVSVLVNGDKIGERHLNALEISGTTQVQHRPPPQTPPQS